MEIDLVKELKPEHGDIFIELNIVSIFLVERCFENEFVK